MSPRIASLDGYPATSAARSTAVRYGTPVPPYKATVWQCNAKHHGDNGLPERPLSVPKRFKKLIRPGGQPDH